tara:strand:+ start:270 stop:860 length:591 start_codon:yes stop_codon:yes gene_type:complete
LVLKLLSDMRVIGGYLKGQKILIPLDKSTRPLKDRVRQSIFNIIEHSRNENLNLNGSQILDLFAGTGSFGIECLSRGAENVIFFENNSNSNKILEQNLQKLELENKTKVLDYDSYEFKKNQLSYNKFDLIFLDPPFKDNKINKLIDKIKKINIADKNTLIVLHRNKKTKEKISDNLNILREEYYGISKIIFGRILS